MKTWIVAFTLVFAFPLAGLASDKSPSGVSRPGLSTNPRGYLRNFPLGKVPADEVIQYVGTPDKTYTLAGRDYIAYDIEPKQGNGKIEYTYIVKDGVVVEEKASNDGYTWWDASEQCASVIRSLGPYRFFVTITFQVLLQKHQAVAQASTIQRRVKRTVLGKHWLKRNRDQGLEGLAFLEKASVLCPSPGKPRSKLAKGNFHFHILIKDHPRLPRDDAEALRKLRIAYSRAIRHLQRFAELHELNDIQSSLTSLDFGYEGLRVAKPFC